MGHSWPTGASVAQLAVVVLVGRAAKFPATRPELQHLQQEQAGHGAYGLLQQEAVPQQEEELVHALAIHLLQLVPDAVQLQYQAVHLGRGTQEKTGMGSRLTFFFQSTVLHCESQQGHKKRLEGKRPLNIQN